MTNTPHLGMPFIEGSQAQKHVTHNEALRILDAAVQIGVRDTDRTAPPSAPVDGDRHIVASGATGAWAGQANAVAVREDGAWRFLAPGLGWCAWSDADGALLVYDGAAWIAAAAGGGFVGDSLARLGINDTASDPNLLTVRSNAALFNAVDVADSGTGDMRLQIFKEASANTASVVFSRAFSGRAEFGLVESDAFKLKVSNDGSSFVEALSFDQATGNAAFQRGLSLTGAISPPQIAADQNDYAPAGFPAASTLRLSSDASRNVTGLAGGADGRTIIVHNVGSQNIVLNDQDTASAAANRFLLGATVTLAANASLSLRYDGTTQRWRAISTAISGGGGGGGGGTAGMTDTERRNLLLGLIYQSKSFAECRRLVNVFATGFKGASDALNGILTGSSSNYTVTPGSAGAMTGYVAPSSTGTVDGNFGQANNNAISFGGAGSSTFHGFRWTATGTGTISSVVVNVSTFTTGGNATAKLYSNGSGNPGTQIGTSSNTVNITGTGNVTFTFSSPPAVTAGNVYWIVFDASGGGSLSTTLTTATTIAGYDSGRAATAAGVAPDNYGSSLTIKVQINSTTVTNNMTLVTVAQTADSSVTNGRVLLEYANAASPTLNTDLTAEVSCNGGTNWVSATLSAVTSYSQGGRKVAETADTVCTSGTDFRVRIKTLNNKNVPIYGVALTVH